jgi:hypothetical protein
MLGIAGSVKVILPTAGYAAEEQLEALVTTKEVYAPLAKLPMVSTPLPLETILPVEIGLPFLK